MGLAWLAVPWAFGSAGALACLLLRPRGCRSHPIRDSRMVDAAAPLTLPDRCGLINAAAPTPGDAGTTQGLHHL